MVFKIIRNVIGYFLIGFFENDNIRPDLRSCKSTNRQTKTLNHFGVFQLVLPVQPTGRKHHCQNTVGF